MEGFLQNLAENLQWNPWLSTLANWDIWSKYQYNCTMSILTFVKCKLSAVHLKVKKLECWGILVGFLANVMWYYNPRLLTISNEIPDLVKLLVEIFGEITSMNCTMSILTFVKCKFSKVHLKWKSWTFRVYGRVLSKI